jgi:superfamily II helicase
MLNFKLFINLNPNRNPNPNSKPNPNPRVNSPWGDGPEGEKKREIFLNSEIFSESFFRDMMGMFISDALHIRIENNNSNDGNVQDDRKEITEIRSNFGSGMFQIYSKLNHSCCCNTVNQGED